MAAPKTTPEGYARAIIYHDGVMSAIVLELRKLHAESADLFSEGAPPASNTAGSELYARWQKLGEVLSLLGTN